MLDEIMLDVDERMSKALESFEYNMKSIRTGRATPSLIEDVKVQYYGTPTPLYQIASISAPDANTLLIKPFDPSNIPDVRKGINQANLGLNPTDKDGQIYLSIPSLTEETRRSLTKDVSKKTEDGRVSIRNVRREAISDIRDMEKEKMISEDESRNAQEQVQEKTDDHIKKLEELAKAKEKEIMTI
ncbi:MAG: ribosome recycling factor [Chloroflexota bacterium]